MAAEHIVVNIADIPALRPIAQEVSRTRQRKRIPVDGEDVTIIIEPNRRKHVVGKTHATRAEDSFLASYQAIPPLGRRLSVEQMTEIAAEEHAQESARKDL